MDLEALPLLSNLAERDEVVRDEADNCCEHFKASTASLVDGTTFTAFGLFFTTNFYYLIPLYALSLLFSYWFNLNINRYLSLHKQGLMKTKALYDQYFQSLNKNLISPQKTLHTQLKIFTTHYESICARHQRQLATEKEETDTKTKTQPPQLPAFPALTHLEVDLLPEPSYRGVTLLRREWIELVFHGLFPAASLLNVLLPGGHIAIGVILGIVSFLVRSIYSYYMLSCYHSTHPNLRQQFLSSITSHTNTMTHVLQNIDQVIDTLKSFSTQLSTTQQQTTQNFRSKFNSTFTLFNPILDTNYPRHRDNSLSESNPLRNLHIERISKKLFGWDLALETFRGFSGGTAITTLLLMLFKLPMNKIAMAIGGTFCSGFLLLLNLYRLHYYYHTTEVNKYQSKLSDQIQHANTLHLSALNSANTVTFFQEKYRETNLQNASARPLVISIAASNRID